MLEDISHNIVHTTLYYYLLLSTLTIGLEATTVSYYRQERRHCIGQTHLYCSKTEIFKKFSPRPTESDPQQYDLMPTRHIVISNKNHFTCPLPRIPLISRSGNVSVHRLIGNNNNMTTTTINRKQYNTPCNTPPYNILLLFISYYTHSIAGRYVL